jgi:hypothetical protein
MNKRTLGVAAVFLVGCAVGGVSSQLVVPNASAQATARTKWEYTCVLPHEKVTAVTNRLGADGWELVTTSTSNVYCFKRAKL